MEGARGRGLDRMLGKYSATRQEGVRRRLGLAGPRFPVLLQPFFFFFPPFLIFLVAGPSSQESDTGLSYPPAARVGEAGCCPPCRGGGQVPGLRLGRPQETCSAASLPPAPGPRPLPDM